MDKDFKKFFQAATGQIEQAATKAPEIMQGTFAARGSKPYYVLGSIGGMKIGFKYMAAQSPLIAVGVRFRIAWEAGHSDFDTAKEKFKRPLMPGSTETNAGYAIWLPVQGATTHLGFIREAWEKKKGAELLADYILGYMKEIGVTPSMSREQIIIVIDSGFDHDFPHLTPTEQETGVMEMVPFLLLCRKIVQSESIKKPKEEK